MTETTSDSADRGNVELFRAVSAIPFARLKDVLCAQYGATRFDAEWQMVQDTRRCSVVRNNNLSLYLGITNRLGRKRRAVGEIMRAYRDIAKTDYPDKGPGEISTAQRAEPLVDPENPTALDNSPVESAETTVYLEDTEDMSEYMEAVRCNTTRSCCLELGAVGLYGSEDYSQEACDYEESVSRSELRGERLIPGNLRVLEDDTVEGPRVIIDEE